jgi:hypothetical protein
MVARSCAKKLEWNNKSTEVDIITGRTLDNVSKWTTYFIPATKRGDGSGWVGTSGCVAEVPSIGEAPF